MSKYDTLNLILAWLPALCVSLLSVIYPLRIICKKRQLPPSNLLCRINGFLRKIHKHLGMLVILFAFIHCRVSSQKLGLNSGTLCLIVLVLLALTYLFRKSLKRSWLLLHRWLTVLLLVVIVLHILITRLTDFNF